MSYVRINGAALLKDGEKMKVSIKDRQLLVTKMDGAFYALDNKCPHMGGSLADGNLEDGSIVCPRHGSAFDVKTGKALHGGKLAFVKFKVGDATIYPVKVEDGEVLVAID